jgi:hypothetical protein
MQSIWMMKPRVVVLSAMLPESLPMISRLAAIAGAHPNTQFVLGGAAFRDASKWPTKPLPPNMTVMGTDMTVGAQQIQALLAAK